MINANLRKTASRVNADIDKVGGAFSNTLETIQNVASKSLYLGVGLAAVVSDNIGDFVKDTVEYGEKIEKRQMRRLAEFRSDLVDRVKEMFGFSKRTIRKAERMMEDTLDVVIDDLNIPRKSDVHRIDRKLNQIQRNTSAKMKTKHSRKQSNRAH